MSHTCGHGSCETNHEHHEHSSLKGCGCSCHQCQCCSSENKCRSECDKGQKLLALADEAWMEVLKEKIKDHIRSTDKKIDELAKIVAEGNRDLWHQRMAKAKAKENYSEKLGQLFNHHSK